MKSMCQVKYLASQGQVPIGLKGQHYAAIFGGNTSLTEALLVKRRIMGPSWITLKNTRRVEKNTQVLKTPFAPPRPPSLPLSASLPLRGRKGSCPSLRPRHPPRPFPALPLPGLPPPPRPHPSRSPTSQLALQPH